MASPFDPDPETQARWMAALATLARDHFASLDSAPTNGDLDARPEPGAIPEAPLAGGVDAAFAIISEAARQGLNPASPGYLAFVPGGGLYATAMADFVADILNRFTGLREPSPAFVQMELDVIAWLAREFGYADGGGALTSGGSAANFLAVRAARRFKQPDPARAVAYRSTQAHGSVADAVDLAGLPRERLRAVAVDSRYRMRVDDLARRVAQDRAEGLQPFLVVANGGTVDTGAIDPLPEIAAFCTAENLWMHVDAAYGGGFMLCAEGKRRLDGIALADTITFDPHKGMFLPYGTGCILFKHPPPEAHDITQEGDRYLSGFKARIAPDPYRLELSRPFRGLRLWLPLMLHGAKAFRDAVAEKLALARVLHDGLVRLAEEGYPLDIVDTPQLSIAPFRLRRRRGEALDDWNARTNRLLAAVNKGEVSGVRRSYFNATYLDVAGERVLTLRPCVLSHRTGLVQIQNFLEDLRAALDHIAAQAS